MNIIICSILISVITTNDMNFDEADVSSLVSALTKGGMNKKRYFTL